jgi:hypothetical protein
VVMRQRLAMAAFALASAGLACQIVAGIERVEKVPPTPDSSTEDVAPPPTDPCAHTAPPPQPGKSDAKGEDDELPPFILAVRSFNLIPPSGTAVPGFDLDKVCTCETREPTAGEGGATCRLSPTATGCDEDGGIDNAAVRLFDEYKQVISIDDSANVNDEINNGQKTLLLQIAGYNGLPNDPNVNVGVFPSDGLVEEPPTHPSCDASTKITRLDRPDATFYTPVYCGQDKWTVIKETAIGSNRPLVPVRTGSGWVKDGILVVQVNDALQIPFFNSVIGLVTARMVGRLVPLDQNLKPRDPTVPPTDAEKRLWELREGVLAGRIPARDILAAVGSLDDPLDKQSGKHLCSTPLFGTARDAICGYLDIPSNPQRDSNLQYSCDALSAAFGFAAFAALDGDLVPKRDVPNECAIGEGDRPVDAGNDVVYACPLAGP